MPQLSLDTIAEVSVTLAGFSGLAAAFRKRGMRDWAAWERLWFWYILNWSLGSLLFSLLPGVLGGLGVGSSVAWPVSNVSFALFIVVSVGYGAREGLRLQGAGLAHPRSAATSIALVPALVAALLLACSAAGFGTTPAGAYQLALFLTLGLACGSFFLFLQYPLSE